MSIAEISEQTIPFALKLNGKFRNTQTRTGVLILGLQDGASLHPSLNTVMRFALSGWPEHSNLPLELFRRNFDLQSQ